MPTIELITYVNAPIIKCFDIARSIDVHKESMKHSQEEAIAGVTSGLIGEGEEVTWRARHFGVVQRFTSRITQFTYPYHFRDEMVSGAFKSFRHDHYFIEDAGKTIMKDILLYESPLGSIGKLVNKMFLTAYLTRLLTERNKYIQYVAEH